MNFYHKQSKHNGARFFVHLYYGGGFEVFGLKEIHQHYIEYDYKNLIPEGWYPVGCDNGDMLFINSKECCVNQRENSYLYWTEMLFTDSAIELELNFERWLERFFMCNGSLFLALEI
ncbi:SMI1/KNR4 family protein [Aneurinibacillus sp. BA2021]|nr:SMI1/KNR4 family protein [Aneurinibacillus sp. BA2021]